MSDRSRVEQRDNLLTMLGMLVGPIRNLIEHIETERPRIPYIEGQFCNDFRRFTAELEAFCRSGSIVFQTELDLARTCVAAFTTVIAQCRSPNRSIETIATEFHRILNAAQSRIRAIPCDDPGTILPGESPLQTYVRLRAICAGVGTRLDILDPFLTADVSHRYLADVAPTARITVVTHEKLMKETMRWDRLIAVSELLARARPTTYRFLVTDRQHDRHCRADDKILHLGGSFKDASKDTPYTISNLEALNHSTLDEIIAGAREWFGPTITTHRKS